MSNSFVFATLSEINCDDFIVKWISNWCDSCFIWSAIYKGKGVQIWDDWLNWNNYKDVYFEDENTGIVEITNLNDTVWAVSNPLFKYPDTFVWYTAKDGRKYHIFDVSDEWQEYLEPYSDTAGIFLNSVGENTNKDLPAIRVKVTSYYHDLLSTSPVNLSEKVKHVECYFYKSAWCWDGEIQSKYEQCDNWNQNWNWNWAPAVVNWVACNNSCEIVQPVCWEAEWNYSYNDTDFRWEGLPNDKAVTWRFCSNYSELDGSVPSFPSPGSSVSWTCKLGNITVTCSASRESESEEPENPGWWGWGGGGTYPWGWGGGSTQPQCDPATNGQTLDSQPSSDQLCSVWTPSTIQKNTTSWTRTCEYNWQTVNCEAYKSKCAVQWTCTEWECWRLDWKEISITDTATLLKFENPQPSDQDFCKSDNGDTILSYNPSLNSKEFTWYCGTSQCHAYLKYPTKWIIKIYGSYTWATLCPECVEFSWADEEPWSNRVFYSDFDTKYTRSIMSGDYLPFGWILPDYQDYVTDCNSTTVWKYNKNTVQVRFDIINRNWTTIWSNTYTWFNGNLLPAFQDVSVVWQGWAPSSLWPNYTLGENTIKWYIISRQVCKSVTDADGNITYQWGNESINENFATQTFTVTDHYMIQTNPMSSLSNTYINFDWSLFGGCADEINQPSQLASYDTGSLSKVLNDFVKKYAKYAKLCWVSFKWDSTINYCKIPFEEVYYISWENIVLPEWLEFTQPTTLIVENGNITIKWNIIGSFMLVVKNGKIKIENSNMNTQTVLDGYYITDKWFEVTWPAVSNGEILNTSPSQGKNNQGSCNAYHPECQPYWYADWRLKVNWVLVWPSADEVYKHRRSFLVGRFNPDFGKCYAIKNGASLIISSNPTLWTNAPIGSKDLFEMLKVNKWY